MFEWQQYILGVVLQDFARSLEAETAKFIDKDSLLVPSQINTSELHSHGNCFIAYPLYPSCSHYMALYIGN